MNFGLQGAPYNSNENENNEIDKKKQLRKNKTLRRPINNGPINNGRLSDNNGLPINAVGDRHYNKNVENMLGSIHNQVSPDSDDGMGDFYPPPHAELQHRKINEANINQANMDELTAVSKLNYHVTPLSAGNEQDGPVDVVNVDLPVSKEGFNSLPTNTNHGYYGSPNNYGVNTYTGANNYTGPYNQQVPYYTQMSQKAGPKDQLLEKLNYMILLLEEQKDEKTGHVVEELILYSFLGVFLIFIVDSFARAGKYTR
jgi:hypothetical protein